ncbi:chromosome segregation protein SMC [Sulfurifustis variabilis]|uniref:Chromosome partition protein Smc n=1 Tax=Sulfurifustis variabilis TaxID=1675686 RepID=A0A1B4V2H1_9GAMM|nr:chromosome segregation protein SMC [Sulfurifustis variabilis]BAU47738.1 chromosome segregation protein SMC [Sulfurifustis variabilis]
MRLKTIRLSGFKSFVDPTTIPITGNLIGIVGPNGCGKSNIIDAVRWVMGEMSAKHLRGDSMADVIFNGSNARKPVGKAMVELVFDNSDGSAGGQYAQYTEIAIKREAGRDGQSDYFLNKTRCRRKDITDLFLGTGLGPRAYSIIEQGMVTRIIEAKPEDLRGFIEEAAGISRYKERRRETENRIKHTQENLARVEDIRKELETQLSRLNKQSRAATRYKELKQEERLVRAQLLALKYRELDGKLAAQDAVIREHETALEAALAAQREVEARIEQLRAEHAEALDRQNTVQAEYYTVGNEVSRIEQAIEHLRETREALKREQDQLNRTWAEAEAHLGADQARLQEAEQRLADIAPDLERHRSGREAAAARLRDAEAAMQAWQEAWESASQAAAEPTKAREVQTARIQGLESHVAQLRDREARLAEELATVEAELRDAGLDAVRDEARAIDEACASLEAAIQEAGERLQTARAEREATTQRLEQLRGAVQSNEARLAGLQELQAAAEARHDAGIVEWLTRVGLADSPRLASRIQVESGWETAVERVLGSRLAAVCAERFGEATAGLDELKPARLTVVDLTAGRSHDAVTGTLIHKVKSDLDLAPLLAGVHTADTLEEALSWRNELKGQESIITRDGAWVGRNWLDVEYAAGSERGWLAREREIEGLRAASAELAREIESAAAQLAGQSDALAGLERRREELARELNERQRARAELRERLGHREARLNQLEGRRAQIGTEQQEIAAQRARDESEIAAATERLRQAEADSGTHEAQRAELSGRRAAVQEALAAARAAEATAREREHELEIERRTLETARESVRASIARLDGQLAGLHQRRDELAAMLSSETQENDLRAQLNEQLEKRLEVEERLGAARKATGEADARLRELEQQRHRDEQQVQEIRGGLESERVVRQELVVRRDTFAEQLREMDAEPAQVLAEMPQEATETGWAERLDQILARIERLGPINLVAIEEFQELSERKGYLDKQSEDLSQALATLDEAIRKMDRETRTRFKETFDKVNENFQHFFPKLFGGGSAYLELTDNDLLETGVTVMARPPGKRNSTIHLLSGGEKALSAVALIFSIFELNPAPFCLLDEVDAPLDDANVERYGETLKAMSERTQLVYITHNKISMEMAELLVGVTMSEPGVSRLVAVDVEEAMQMVAQ